MAAETKDTFLGIKHSAITIGLFCALLSLGTFTINLQLQSSKEKSAANSLTIDQIKKELTNAMKEEIGEYSVNLRSVETKLNMILTFNASTSTLIDKSINPQLAAIQKRNDLQDTILKEREFLAYDSAEMKVDISNLKSEWEKIDNSRYKAIDAERDFDNVKLMIGVNRAAIDSQKQELEEISEQLKSIYELVNRFHMQQNLSQSMNDLYKYPPNECRLIPFDEGAIPISATSAIRD